MLLILYSTDDEKVRYRRPTWLPLDYGMKIALRESASIEQRPRNSYCEEWLECCVRTAKLCS